MDNSWRKLTGAAATLTLLVLITACSSIKPVQDTTQSTTPSTQNLGNNLSQEVAKSTPTLLPKTTYKIGELVSVKDKSLNVQVKVNGIREHPGKGVIKPTPGSKWLVVSSTIVNKGQKPKTLSVVSFELMDSKNNQYEVALLAAALEDVKSNTGQINPGEERQGEVAFEVPEGAKELKLLFQPNRSACEALTSKPKTSDTLNCDPVAIKIK